MGTRIALLLLLSASLASVAGGQDLDRLRERVEQFWLHRASGATEEAAAYVEPDRRDVFVIASSFAILDERIVGLEFTANPETVVVRTDARVLVPAAGITTRTFREEWVWIQDEWYWKFPDSVNPFANPTDSSESRVVPDPPEFEFVTRQVDLGTVQQGMLVRGSLEFRTDRRNLTIRPEPDPEIAFGQPRWTSETTGTISFSWDTSLRSTDLDREIRFTVEDRLSQRRVTDTVGFRGRVEGRLRITQVPEVADVSEAGSLEIELQNLTSAPITVVAASIRNPVMELDLRFETLASGETGIGRIDYPAMVTIGGAIVFLTFRQPILNGASVVGIPLSLATTVRDSVPSEYTREQLEEILRQNNLVRP